MTPRFSDCHLAPGLRRSLAMQTIPLDQLQKMFAAMRTEDDSIDGEMLWGYYFTSPDADALEPVAEALDEQGYDLSEIVKSDEEQLFILQAERFESHTPESLFALNAELETLAARFPGVQYDGMDVNNGEDEEEGCGHCGGDEDHECCGGHGEDHECCGGHGEEEREEGHQCCGGHGGAGCCGKHVHHEGEPITNPQILAAVERISTDRSEEAQAQLTLALQRGLYLVPVFKQTDAESADESIQVLVCTDEKNDEYLPLFTDEAALKGWTQEQVAAMVLTAPEAWDFILTQPDCAGAVINPAGASLPLNREMVGILKKMIDDHEAKAAE